MGNDLSVQEIISNVEEIANSYYQRNDNMGYQMLIQLIDSLTELMDDITAIDTKSEFFDMKEKMKEVLNRAMDAMIDKDTILLADILRYDLLEILTDMERILKG